MKGDLRRRHHDDGTRAVRQVFLISRMMPHDEVIASTMLRTNAAVLSVDISCPREAASPIQRSPMMMAMA